MSNPAVAALRCRFGEYELDCAAHCLRKNGIRVKLQPIPYQTLLVFLDRPNQLIKREELQQRLWPQGTFVDFEQGLNVAIKKLRDALCDSADSPRFIETVSGQGYRWIAEVEIAPGAEATSRMPADRVELGRLGATDAEPRANRESKAPGDAAGRRRLQAWAVAAGLLTVATAGFFARAALRHPAPILGSPGWVLITNFENRTHQAVLDGSLEYALERELSNSRFVKVAPRGRVEDALRLMKRPVDSRIDARLGREICLRDGEIQALITGRVEKIGTNYVLSAELRNAATDVVTAGFAEEDADEKQLADAVQRLSRRMREKLGEDPQLIQPSNAKLEKVTTPSLRALQLYSEADRSIADGKSTEAESLLREAVKADSGFASGYILLAYAIRNQNRPIGDWKPAAERAFHLSDEVLERERYFIRGSYYELTGDDRNAADNYQVLVKLYSDDFWGTNNLALLVKDRPRACALFYHAADLRPKNFQYAVEAWYQALSTGDGPAIDKYYHRAMELITLAAPDEPARAEILLGGVVRELGVNDIKAAHAELERVESQFNSLSRDWQESLAFYLGTVHLYLGELRSAEKWFGRVNDEGDRQFGLGQIAYERRRSYGVQRMKKIPLDPVLVARFASDGDSSAANRAISERTRQGRLACRLCGNPFYGPLFRAEAEASSGKYAQGMEGLRKQLATSEEGLGKSNGLMCAANLLAHHLEAKGDFQGAATILETLNDQQDLSLTWAGGWAADTRFHLGELYRKIGRSADAQIVEGHLQEQLMFADPDHPILLALKRVLHERSRTGDSPL